MACRFLAIASLIAGSTACASSDSTRVLSVSDIEQGQHFYEGEYLGEVVTVMGEVEEIQSARSMKISDGGYGDEKLLVVTARPVQVSPGEKLRVTGTAGQLREWFPAESLPYIQEALYDKGGTTAYLYDATLTPAAAER